jgi:anti-repressor protein
MPKFVVCAFIILLILLEQIKKDTCNSRQRITIQVSTAKIVGTNIITLYLYFGKQKIIVCRMEAFFMKNSLTVFESEQFGKIRTVCIYSVPYFVGEDVAEILGYANPQKAIHNYINDEDKMINELFNVNGTKGILINEIGLYSLVISSKSPIAKQFEKWIIDEVLPSIHKQSNDMNKLAVIKQQEILGKPFTLYGDFENPLFLAKEVAEWIEYDVSSINKMIRNIDEEEKVRNIIPTLGGNQETWFLTEDGVYEVLMQSRKPIAKKFKKEVKAVLKSIRKYGAYMTAEKIEEVLTNPDMIIQLAMKLKEERAGKEKLKTENLQQKQFIRELKQKADYTDMILQSKDLVTITQIAKDYGMSGNKMNQLLHNLKVQYKQNGQWLLYADYHAKGYTQSETIHFKHSDGRADTKMITKWTQKNRLFLYNLLKQSSVLPVIEQNIAA